MTRQNLGNYTTTWHYDLIFNFYCFWREIYCYLFHYFFVYNTCFLPVCCTDFSFATWFEWHSVQFSRSVVSDSLWSHELQHARPPCSSPTLGVYPNSCALSWWYHPTILSSVTPFSSCPQSFPASGSFQMSQLLAKVLEFQLQHQSFQWTDFFRMDWLDLLAVQGTLKSLLQTTVEKHQFFSTQLSL